MLARVVQQRSGALLQRLQENAQNAAEIAQLKKNYLHAHPNDYAGWTAVLKAAKSLDALRSLCPAPVAQPAAPQAAAPIVDERPGLAAALTTVDNGRTIGPFGNPGPKVAGAKAPCYYNDDGDYCITPDRDGHAGEGAWKLLKRGSKGWGRVDTLHPDGTRMYRG